MNAPPDPVRLARQWVQKAEEDLRTAEYILTMPRDCPYGTVCFHSQQCVEKYIKALLVWRSIDFPKVHDVGELARLLPPGVSLPLPESEQEQLTDYATVSRYPGDWEPIERVDAERAVAGARKAREAIRVHLPKETLEG